MNLSKIITIVQAVISVLLIIAILLQQRGAGASAITGGTGGSAYYARRGFEKFLFAAIVILAVLFVAMAVASIFIASKY
ncbi:MAG: preprotein translocase subunit SecG [Candidatus Portnoybacteria bacterium RIFCSPLOWO2_02_FULL_39_11]|uniref:Protein-export membrane protein SecG n=1 Tax=Candidatus Portnoybacteria bacterium RIFCSPLOWO2_02_FULL_39_11 TaxID=1802001 RepID=A0A1G2FQX3_9BACT|nr:MAG: preprotein translocase subunit SecG [Candidatus Portnoybacteria bacterium RIFCSPLOWO2_02_FULL_39_11]